MSIYRKKVITVRNKYNESPVVEEKYVNLEWIVERLKKIGKGHFNDNPHVWKEEVDQLIQEIKEAK